ncbi:MAG: hypothetical protein WC551_07480 [Patescibacteria group bacterium]
MKRFLSKLSIIALMANTFLFALPTRAAGVTVTLTPGSSSSTSNLNVSMNWTRSIATTYATGTTITVTIQGSTSTASEFAASSTTPSIDLDGNLSNDADYTSTSTSGNSNSITWTVVTTTISTNSFTVPINFAYPSTSPQNFSFAVFVSGVVDFGASEFYANGGNQVNVTANIPSLLAFSIRNSADTANTNNCNLGTLSTTASSTCDYRLRVGVTNAASGFQVYIAANADLNSFGSATITQAVDNAASAPGTEQYGIEVYGASSGGRTPGGLFTNPVAVDSPANFTFDVNTSPVPTSTKNFINYPSPFDPGTAPQLTKTTWVKHFANISAGTPSGNYSQIVTYTVTAYF